MYNCLLKVTLLKVDHAWILESDLKLDFISIRRSLNVACQVFLNISDIALYNKIDFSKNINVSFTLPNTLTAI